MKRDDGGQAFPRMGSDGMSLRDYFAAQALAAGMVIPEWRTWSAQTVAATAYAYADAMLKARGTVKE